MKKRESLNSKQILFFLFSFILLSILLSGNSYAIPNIRTTVCDVIITERNQTNYEGIPINCMDYSYWDKNCNEIYNRTELFSSEYYATRKFTFTYTLSNLEVNRTYRITGNVFANWFDVRIVNENRDLFEVTKNLCQEENRKVMLESFTDALIVISILAAIVIFILFKFERGNLRKFLKPNLIKQIIIVFVLCFFAVLFILFESPTATISKMDISDRLIFCILLAPSGVFSPITYYFNLRNSLLAAFSAFVALVIYYYLLSCLIVWIYDKIRKPKP